jgi:hypothetical protein
MGWLREQLQKGERSAFLLPGPHKKGERVMFPGAHARIYRNEAGEVIGWDYPSDDEPQDPEWEEYGHPDDWCDICEAFIDEEDHEHAE